MTTSGYFTTLKAIRDHSDCTHDDSDAEGWECERQRVMFQVTTMAREIDRLADSLNSLESDAVLKPWRQRR